MPNKRTVSKGEYGNVSIECPGCDYDWDENANYVYRVLADNCTEAESVNKAHVESVAECLDLKAKLQQAIDLLSREDLWCQDYKLSVEEFLKEQNG